MTRHFDYHPRFFVLCYDISLLLHKHGSRGWDSLLYQYSYYDATDIINCLGQLGLLDIGKMPTEREGRKEQITLNPFIHPMD